MQGGFSRENGSNFKGGAQKEKAGVWFTMSIKDLHRCMDLVQEDLVLRVKTVKVDKIIILGRISHMNKMKHGWELTINDTTGSATVFALKLPAYDTPTVLENVDLTEGDYVKLILNYRKFEGKDRLGVEHAEVVKDHNLISNHILVSLHAMLSVDNDVNLEAVDSALGNTTGARRTNGNNSGSQMVQEDPYAHLSGRAKFEAHLREVFSDMRVEKLSTDQIKSKLGKHFVDSEINSHLRDLVDQGDLSDSMTNEKKYYEFTS